MENLYLEVYEKYKNVYWIGDIIFGESPRDKFIFEYSFAVPNQEALDTLAALAPVIEMGAGGGYWAYVLKSMGVEIKPFDNFSSKWPMRKKFKIWTEVERGDQEILLKEEFKNHTLFLCWPCISLPFLKNFSGSHVVYVGETEHGCCAELEFFEELDKSFVVEKRVEIPQWGSMGDEMVVYRRK